MEKIISNRKFIDIDTMQSVDNYIDTLCADPAFLCKSDEHRQLCGTNTSIYANVQNVNDICENIVSIKLYFWVFYFPLHSISIL